MTTVIVEPIVQTVEIEKVDSTVVVEVKKNTVEIQGIGAQGPTGPAGATGATGATGPQGPPGAAAQQTPWTQAIDADGYDLSDGGRFSLAGLELGSAPFTDTRVLSVIVGPGDSLAPSDDNVEVMSEFSYFGTPELGTLELDALNILALPINPAETDINVYGVIMSAALAGGQANSVTALNFNFGTAPDFLGQPDADVEVGAGCGATAVAFGGTLQRAVLYTGSFVSIGGEITVGTVLDVRTSQALTQWGLMLGPWDSNLQGGLKLGGSGFDEALDSSVLFDLASTTRVMRVSRLTTSQRNALTALEGMLIFNTTDKKYQGYSDGSWVNLS